MRFVSLLGVERQHIGSDAPKEVGTAFEQNLQLGHLLAGASEPLQIVVVLRIEVRRTLQLAVGCGCCQPK